MSSTIGLIVMLLIFGLYGYLGERAEARERRRGRAITAPQRLDDTQTAFRSDV
jgi:hypothetical protein